MSAAAPEYAHGRAPAIERIIDKIVLEPNDCWRWTGSIASTGYGQLTINYRNRAAHRVSYEEFIGPIPEGLDLDHLCRNRWCVNPGHLEPVTHRENALRGISPVAENARKTHCIHGHEFTPENTRFEKNGSRACRACAREKERRRTSVSSYTVWTVDRDGAGDVDAGEAPF